MKILFEKILFEKIFENNFLDTIVKCSLFSMLGLILGLTINMITKYMDLNSYNQFNQLFCCIITLAFIQSFISKKLVNKWLDSLEGLFFVATFFSIQYKMFANINYE